MHLGALCTDKTSSLSFISTHLWFLLLYSHHLKVRLTQSMLNKTVKSVLLIISSNERYLMRQYSCSHHKSPCLHQKLQELHLKGADLTALDQSGCSLLHHAVTTGSKETVRYILNNGNHGKTISRYPTHCSMCPQQLCYTLFTVLCCLLFLDPRNPGGKI